LSQRTAITVNFDYQQRAREFHVDDRVTPIGADSTDVGRVLEVWPGIGVVDVEWATGHRRMNVEDIIILNESGVVQPPMTTQNVPGGTPVRPGRGASAVRVASEWLKSAIYWAERDRGYRATKSECSNKSYYCPKCGHDHPMRKTIYKRDEGKSITLMACPGCLFLIKTNRLHGHHKNTPPAEEVF